MNKIVGRKIANEKWYVFKIKWSKIPQFHNLKILTKNQSSPVKTVIKTKRNRNGAQE